VQKVYSSCLGSDFGNLIASNLFVANFDADASNEATGNEMQEEGKP
jgi:hypothetical protein